jgi:DNA-binding transcriptional ArsR family regulator
VDGARGGVDRVFAALGDAGRRSLVEAVASRGTATATELAADLPVTRQAVAKQLSALADAGLLRSTRAGRETRYEVTPAPLEDAVEWMVSVGAAWDERLAALRRSLGSTRRPATNGKAAARRIDRPTSGAQGKSRSIRQPPDGSGS